MLAVGVSQAAWPPRSFLMEEHWHRKVHALSTVYSALVVAEIFITADGLWNSENY